MVTITHGEGTVLRGWYSGEDYSFSLRNSDEAVDAVPQGTTTVGDTTFSISTAAGVQHKSDVVIENHPTNPDVELLSLTPEVCAVTQAGEVSMVSAGVCSIEMRGQTGVRHANQALYLSGASSVYTSVASFEAGSLREYLRARQLAELSGVIPGAATQRAGVNGVAPYGGVNAGNFLFNTTLPADAIALMLVSDDSIGWRAWVTPHHYLTWVGHDDSYPGGILPDGSGYAHIKELRVVYSTAEYAGTKVKLLPANWKTYLPDVPSTASALGNNVACWARLYRTYVSGEERWVMPVSLSYGNPWPVGDSRRQYQKFLATGTPMFNGGDSGSPVFCGIHDGLQDNLVLLTHVEYQGQAGSQMYADYLTQINAALNSLATSAGDPAAGTYVVQTVDLSGFTSYP